MAGSVVPRAGAGPRAGNRGQSRYQRRGEGGALFQPSFSFRVSRFPLPVLRILRLPLRAFLPAQLWPFLPPATRHLVKCQ